ncbi:MAG: cbb3-type cytochrome c oxidase subunit II [Anditalea sp.]
MLDFHKNHQLLLITILVAFVFLSIFIAVIPAYKMQDNQPLPEDEPMTEAEVKGLSLYISEGCVSCHTQQVRSIEMDNVWGSRPSMPSDYYYSKQRMGIWRQSPSILGSQRTGPDLSNVGQRQPGDQWHLLHLYNPRIVVEESVMPAYPWLFTYEENPAEDEVVVAVPSNFRNGTGEVVASQEALDLVAYLKSLKQPPLVAEGMSFIPSRSEPIDLSGGGDDDAGEALLPDGANLYTNTCAACHQADGKGIPGAFPPLANSPVVNDADPELMIRIIMQGYDAHPEWGQMPGFANLLTDEEIAAIINHEKSGWGNNAPEVSVEQVTDIRKMIEEM